MIQIAGGIVWNPKLGIVVVSQNNNSWSLPKGHVEENEENLNAAIREIYEETGVPHTALILKGKIAEYERPKIKRNSSDVEEMRHITLYLFMTNWEELSPQDAENPEALWVNPKDVPTLLSHPIDKVEFERMINSEIFLHNSGYTS